MIKTIIVDDDAKCSTVLREILINIATAKIEVLSVCSSAADAKQAITSGKPDIIFLDVEMPGKNGFDLLNELPEIDFDIVFVTAFEKYAIQAIKSSALDFLLKPVEEKEVIQVISRFEAKKRKDQTLQQIRVLLENYARSNEPVKRIAVPTNTGLEFIGVDQIIRLEAESSYTTFFFAGNTKLLVAKTLKEMEDLLPPKLFYRVHSSHLININFVKRFQKSDGGVLIMDDKSNIPVSRHRKEEFLEFLKNK